MLPTSLRRLIVQRLYWDVVGMSIDLSQHHNINDNVPPPLHRRLRTTNSNSVSTNGNGVSDPLKNERYYTPRHVSNLLLQFACCLDHGAVRYVAVYAVRSNHWLELFMTVSKIVI